RDDPRAQPAPAARRARWLQERRRASGPHPDPPPRAGEGESPRSSHCQGLFEFGGPGLGEVQAPTLARMEELGGLESVAGDADHDRLVTPDPSIFDHLPEAGDDAAAPRFA